MLRNNYPCEIKYKGNTYESVKEAFKDCNDWTDMYYLLLYKFSREPFKSALLKTGNSYIKSKSKDSFWGEYNMMGRIMMEVRNDIKKKKIIVTGSRNFRNYDLMKERLDFYFKECEPIIVCGETKGADYYGKKYARENNLDIISCPAAWSMGKGAGYIRNEYMAEIADGLIAFWDGKSKGTKHMIETMKSMKKPVRIVKYEL